MNAPATDAARERARRPDGRFGDQARAEADVSLTRSDLVTADYRDSLAYLRSLLADDRRSRTVRTPLADIAARSPRSVSPAEIPPLAFTHPDLLDPGRIAPVGNQRHNKPSGGLWLTRDTPGGPTPWEEWLDREGYRPHDRPMLRQSVALRENARVLVIDSAEDFAGIVHAYPPPPGQDPGSMSALPIDFEALGSDYDALWVTARGAQENRLRPDEHDLNAWDVETVLVFDRSALHTGSSTGTCHLASEPHTFRT